MSRHLRLMAWLSLSVLIGSLVAVSAQVPVARADTTSRIYYVDNTGDADLASNSNACQNDNPNSDCSLRQAIERANSDSGGSTIDFTKLDTSDSGYNGTTDLWTIKPISRLPTLTADGTIIQGRDDNALKLPRVVIDGSLSGTSSVGLRISGSGCVITKMIIVNFAGNTATTGIGVHITGATAFDNQVLGSYIGVKPRDLTKYGNQRAGIQIDNGATTNRVGSANGRNVIAGNGTGGTQGDGILITGSGQGTGGTVIEGNYIGIALDGSGNVGAASNTGFGIQIADSGTNTVGSSSFNSRNVISSNGQSGILLTGSSAGNQILGNLIGLGADGTTAFGNSANGVYIADGATNTTVQGTVGSALVISGNGGYGVLIADPGTDNNTVAGAYIGLNNGATTAVPNGLGGVRVQDNATNTKIGLASAGNVISGNTGYGVSIGRTVASGYTNTSGTTVRNNTIGLTLDGTAVRANTVGGVLVDSSARNTIIGGGGAGEGNVISGNGTVGAGSPTGVVINATAVVSTTVAGNTIGLRRAAAGGAFTAAAGNQGGGVVAAASAQGVQIGGAAGEANTISSNIGSGVVVNTGATGVQISANSVLTNTLAGISVTGVTTPTITANTVRGNQGGNGILVSGGSAAIITSNLAQANAQAGIQVTASSRAQISANSVLTNTLGGLVVSGGDATQILANTAYGNGANGIAVDTNATRITLSDNISNGNTQSGMSLTATTPFTATTNTLSSSTGGAGLFVTGPASGGRILNNTVEFNKAGGIIVASPTASTNITLTANLIDNNVGSGIRLTGDITNVRIEANSIISNTVNGIQLGNGGSPNPQRVRIVGNSMNRNGIPPAGPFPITSSALQHLGIVFVPHALGSPGTATNPNHDIDPPIQSSLVVDQNGVLTGKVLADGSSAACTTNPTTDCAIAVYSTSSVTRDGQGSTALSPSITLNTSGNFTATLGFVPAQLALTATDKNGNTSEFEVFNATPQVSVSPAQVWSAKPGDVITVTHRITNTGNISFTRLRATTAASLSRWTTTPNPSTQFSLAPNQSKTITYTLRLPNGPDSQVNAGVTGVVTLTLDSGSSGPDAVNVKVADQYTIQQKVVLSLASATGQVAKPNTVVTYQHLVTNSGNVATVVTPGVATTVGGLPAPTWPTTVSPPSLSLAPGASGTFTVQVTVSSGASSGPPPAVALTTLTITPTVSGTPDLTQVKSVVDTTTTGLSQSATLVPSRTRDAAATETVIVDHTVTNTSNGSATFKISTISSQGSVISYILPPASGVTVVNGNTFVLSNQPGFNTYTFQVVIQVARQLLPGQKDFVTVSLTDQNNVAVPSASVVDTINVTRGAVYPRLWLPIVVAP